MEDLIFTINVVVPMFLIMGTGYGLKRFNIISEELIILGNQLCYQVLLPVTLFNSLVNSDFTQSFEPMYILYTLGALMVFFFVTWGGMPLLIKDRRQLPVLDQAMVRSNLVVFGFPLCASIFGAAGTTSVGILTAFVSPVVNTLAVVFYAIYSNEKKTSVKEVVKNVVTSPLIICTVVGALFVLCRIPIPQVATSALNSIGSITTPLALLLLGADFKFGGLAKNFKPLLVGILGRHLIVPVLALVGAYFMGITGANFVSLIAVFAGPVAASSFAMSRVYGADHEFTGQYVVVSSAFAALSIFGAVFLARIAGII